MVNYIPDLSVTFLIAAIAPLIIGFIVGMVVKAVFKIGIVIAAIVLILIFLGIISPSQVLNPIASALKSGAASSTVSAYVDRLAGYLPWSSLTFIVGVALGFWKG